MISDRRKQAIIEMAKRGTLEEQKIAESIIEKNGISIEDEISEKVEFKFKNDHEEILLKQIWAMVVDSIEICYWKHPKKKNVLIFDLKKEEEIELNLFYSVYKRELEKEIKTTVKAFIQVNNIFTSSSLKNPEIVKKGDDALRILNRAGTIDKTNIRKQIEGRG